MKKIKLKTNKLSKYFLSTFLVFSLAIASISAQTLEKNSDENSKDDIVAKEELFPILGNRIKNPMLNYSSSDKQIPDWNVAAINILTSETAHKAEINLAQSSYWNGYRELKDIEGTRPFYMYAVKNSNPYGEVYSSKTRRTNDNNSKPEKEAFILLSQATKLIPGKKYYLRAEVSSTNGTSSGLMAVYEGNRTSGPGAYFSNNFVVESGTKQIISNPTPIEIGANQSGDVTLSIRHYSNNSLNENSDFKIHRIGFYAQDDYDIQNEVNNLFVDENHSVFNAESEEEAKQKVASIQAKLDGGYDFAPDVRTYVQSAVDKANEMLKLVSDINLKIEDQYEDYIARELKDSASQNVIDEIKKEIEKVTTPSIKKQLEDKLAQLQVDYDLVVLKPILEEQLRDKAKDAKGKIDELTNVTQEEKDLAKKKIDDETDKAVKDIHESKSADDAKNAQNDGITNIESVVVVSTLEDEKNNRKKSLIDKAAESIEKINILSNLEDEKDEFIQKINDELIAGTLKIDEAMTYDLVTLAFENSSIVMDDVVFEAALQDAKINALNSTAQALAETISSVNNLENLSQDEILNISNELNIIFEAAQESINTGDSIESVEETVLVTKDKFDKVLEKARLDDVKAKAIKELEEKAENVNEAIDALIGVSQDLKDKAKQDVNKVLSDTIAIINGVSDASAVETEVIKGKLEMESILNALTSESEENLKKAKEDAKEAILKAKESGKSTIDNLGSLSDEEKQVAKDKLEIIADEAIKSIEVAITPDKVNESKDNGLDLLAERVKEAELDNAKLEAIKVLKEKAESVREEIRNKPSLRQEQIDAAMAEIEATLSEVIKRIDDTLIITDVPKSLQTGIDALEGISAKYQAIDETNFQEDKDKAKEELDQKGKDAKEIIDALPDLSQDEKDKAKEAIDKEVDSGKKAIDDATTPKEVTDKVTETETNIDKVVEETKLDDAKAKAIKELEEKAKSIKEAIDALTGVSHELKDKAKQDIDKVLRDAVDVINDATSVDMIDTEVVNGKTEMESILNALTSESESNINKIKDDLDQKGKDAKEIIDALPNLSQDEKDQAKEAVDKEVDSGKKAIDDATTSEDVAEKVTETSNNIDKIVEEAKLNDAKLEAIKVLKEKAESVREEIRNKPSLRQEQIDAAMAEIETTLSEGIKRIDDTLIITDVPNSLQTGIDALEGISAKYQAIDETNFQEDKDKAKEELDQKGKDAKEIIDALPDLSQDEKDKAKEAIDKEVDSGKKAIDDATTPKEVTDKVTETETNIDKVVEEAKLDDAKVKAIKELEEKAKEFIKLIDDRTDISSDDKVKAKLLIEDILSQGIKKISESTSSSEIDSNSKDTISAMNDVLNNLHGELTDTLPNSGVNQQSTFLIGMLLILLGFVVVIFKKKKKLVK